MQLFTFYAPLYQISFLYSVARMIQPRYVIRDSLVARMNQPRYVIHQFPRSMHLDARTNHTRNEIKCGDFCVCFSNNILSTIKSVIHFVQQVARYDLQFRATSCTLRFTISCNKLHATIYDFVQQVARYDVLIVSPKHIR